MEVQGAGGDIWGTADAFHFVHVPVGSRSGSLQACVHDLQNTNPFAKAGLILRGSADPSAMTAILDVKPDGGIEFMIRQDDGAAMQFVAGTTASLPVCLRLSWNGTRTIRAETSPTGATWTLLRETGLFLPAIGEAGLVVTSHDTSQLATAHFTSAGVTKIGPEIWFTDDVGNVGIAGSTSSTSVQGGTWTVNGAGGDIWANLDAFRYVYRLAPNNDMHLVVRVDDLNAANAFAKAGIMIRDGLDAGAAAIVLNVRPGGDIEFMARTLQNDSMQFLGTAHVTFPVWLQLDWQFASPTTKTVIASYSEDHQNWQTVGAPLTWSMKDFFLTGSVVTSHDTTQLATARFDGLSLLFHDQWGDDIGNTGIIGSASVDLVDGIDFSTTVKGGGSDIWGTKDSFYFVHRGADSSPSSSISWRVVALSAQNPFAKAGVIYRDGFSPDAASVILDLKPDGGVEFMARMCAGCETTFIAGAQAKFPYILELSRGSDGTFTASIAADSESTLTTIGTVNVSMTTPVPGLATTSHDPTQLATAEYDNPPD